MTPCTAHGKYPAHCSGCADERMTKEASMATSELVGTWRKWGRDEGVRKSGDIYRVCKTDLRGAVVFRFFDGAELWGELTAAGLGHVDASPREVLDATLATLSAEMRARVTLDECGRTFEPGHVCVDGARVACLNDDTIDDMLAALDAALSNPAKVEAFAQPDCPGTLRHVESAAEVGALGRAAAERLVAACRPAISSTHAWDVARADMEAWPEARWSFVDATKGSKPHRIRSGVIEWEMGDWFPYGQPKAEVEARAAGERWTRLPDADVPRASEAEKSTTTKGDTMSQPHTSEAHTTDCECRLCNLSGAWARSIHEAEQLRAQLAGVTAERDAATDRDNGNRREVIRALGIVGDWGWKELLGMCEAINTSRAKAIHAEPTGRTHNLKTWPSVFADVLAGRKMWEFRRNDRDFAVGDELRLYEWQPGPSLSGDSYTDREIKARVTYIKHGGQFGIPEGYCVMSIAVNAERDGR